MHMTISDEQAKEAAKAITRYCEVQQILARWSAKQCGSSLPVGVVSADQSGRYIPRDCAEDVRNVRLVSFMPEDYPARVTPADSSA